MELRHLRAFLAVFEERNFTRAAARLHISQPPLSQQIQALEAELGVRLFERGRGGAAPTAAGQSLMPQARAILDQMHHAAEQARRAGRGETGSLAVGFAGSMPFSVVMPQLLRDFRAAWPDVALQLREQPSRAQIDDLLAGRLDVGFIRPTSHEHWDAIQSRLILREPLLLALHTEHPSARHERLSLSALRDEPFILYSATLGSGLREQTLALCLAAGFAPRVAQEVHEMPTLISLVSAGIGVGLVAASMQRAQMPYVRYLPLEDAGAYSDILLAFKRDNPSAPLHNFLALRPAQSDI
ncbi:LysR family transcriptional regulator [Thiomonas sp. FB-Cd]|uniref:LysR family transcriptional regulator n=1 Tax=Thiomonas sp. FB-Cd TaxID=1158292 RepID=UPI0004DF55CE|nr:LysR family transcriptional regulator [Thiomonas sp. FB-Cd]